ncbi:MAG: DUF2911 domain-containing protein [Bacteroidota bacterium]|nr:DUF2911 domain-containing protein [Bacteroidota bacterium]
MKNTKFFFSLVWAVAIIFLLNIDATAQDKKDRPSPPASATKTVGSAKITIDYSSPAVKGRKIWNSEMVPYNKVWRTGANEPTKITLSEDVMVEGKELKAGTYALFTIPAENEWTIIFNKNHQQWGAYDYSEDEDVLRIKSKPKKSSEMNERMKFDIKEKGNNKAEVVLAWENLEVPFTLETKKGGKKSNTKSK